jgi:Holliday junction resolvase RusA-like endonuclease
MVDMSAGLRQWRDVIAWHARQAASTYQWQVTDSPVNVSLRFTIIKPKKPKYSFPPRPDVDKLVRAAFDGFTDSKAIWVDDAHAVTVNAQKAYGEPGMTVLLWKIP